MSSVSISSVSMRARAHPRLSSGIAVAAIVILSTLVRIVISAGTQGPWIFVDELIYSSLGRTVLTGSGIQGVPVSGYSAGYPLLIAPAYELSQNLVTAFAFVKATNALVMSLTAIPVYFIARVILCRRWSLVAAALVVVVPAMAYTSVVMTENAFYPAFALASLAIIKALERPRLLRQLLVIPTIGVCFEIRPQGGALLASYLLAIVFVSALEARASTNGQVRAFARALGQYWVTAVLIVVSAAAALAYFMSRGNSLGSTLGAYSITTEATDRYSVKPIINWTLMHYADLSLWLGIIPFVALLVIICSACSREADGRTRAFGMTAVAIIGVNVPVVAAFVVFSNVGRIEERNLFYVGIFPLVALCWWVANGMTRTAKFFTFAVVIASGLPLAIPYPMLLNQTAASDTFGLYLPWAFTNHVADVNLGVVIVAVGVGVVAAILVWLPSRFAGFLIAIVVALFLLTSVAVDRKTDSAARGAVAQGISGPRDWIDAVVGPEADVTALYPGDLEPLKVWQNEFFNRSVRRVMAISVPMPGNLPLTVVNANPNGTIEDRAGHAMTASYVLVHDSTTVAGTKVAADPGSHMELVRVAEPLRFLDVVTGLFDDGWIGPEAVYTNYVCAAGSVVATAQLNGYLHTTPVNVTVFVGDRQVTTVSVPTDGTPVEIRVDVVPTGGSCQVRYVSDPLAVPDVVLGNGDTRSLGVILSRPQLERN